MSAIEPASKSRVVLIPLDMPDKSRSVTNKKTGEQMQMFLQQCDLHLPFARHPVAYEYVYFNAQDRLANGKQFTLGEGAYVVDQWGNLSINRYAPWVELPAKAATKAA